jgi:outer membrane protein assembly factor BamB
MVICIVAGIVAGIAAAAGAQEWPQFRGPERNGISRDSGILRTWPEAGPAELWRQKIGIGYSAVSVVGDRLYTMYTTQEDDQEIELAAAFDAATGKQLWGTPVGQAIVSDWGNGPRSTPTVDGDTVYVLGSLGKLMALAAADGSKRWEVDLPERFGGRAPYHGFSASVLIEGDTLIVETGAPEGKAFAGLDKATGETRWTVGDDARSPGHSSPLPVDLLGQHQVLYLVLGKIVALSPDGRELWSHPLPRSEAHSMPIFVAPDLVFISGAEGIGAHLFRVTQEESGMSAEEVWSSRVIRAHFSSCAVHEDHIYGFDNATLKCIVTATGEQKWSKRGLGRGSLIVAEDHLIVLSDKGRLLLLEATPAGYVEKGRVQALEGRSWTAPVLAGGKLYLRNHTEMVCYDIKG